MSDLLCFTNQSLCTGDFLERIREIAVCHPAGIVLREKNLSEKEYRNLASAVMEICHANGSVCILHNFAETALALGAENIHLPLPVLRRLTAGQREAFRRIGASCHSKEDALEAQELGCTYITAGHIFETDCKKGLPGRGLDFLSDIVRSVQIPVYAIGGIDSENICAVRQTGVRGACVMSQVMQCRDVRKYLQQFYPLENTQEGGILHGKSGIGNIEDTPQRAQI